MTPSHLRSPSRSFDLRRASSRVAGALVAVAGWLAASSAAHAHGSILSNTCDLHPDNGLRGYCDVTLSAPHIARVGHRIQGSGDPWKWSPYSAVATSHHLELWNMRPDETYEYRVQVGPVGHAMATTGTLPTTFVPPNVEDMAFETTVAGASEVDYVLFNSACSGQNFLVVVDRDGVVVWYQEIDDLASGGVGNTVSGFNVSHDANGQPTILATISKREIVELAYDGTLLHYDGSRLADCGGAPGDLGPCPHHDIVRPSYSDGVLWVSASVEEVTISDPYAYYFRADASNNSDYFVDDGVVRMNAAWTSDVASVDLMNIPTPGQSYDPAADPGPLSSLPPTAQMSSYYDSTLDPGDGLFDWTHVNALFPSDADGSESWYLSLRQWDQIVKYRPGTGAIDWVLSPWTGYSDFSLSTIVAGDATFYGQHNVSVVGDPTDGGYVQMFDNREGAAPRGESNDSRVIRVGSFDGTSAVIEESFVLRDADPSGPSTMYCSHQGSGVTMPTAEDHVLALCNAANTIVEIDENDGQVTRPAVWELRPSASTCSDLGGFYRAYPLSSIGFD